MAARLPVEFGRISPHLAREEGRASHSEGLHRLTRAHTHGRTFIGAYLHIRKCKATHGLIFFLGGGAARSIQEPGISISLNFISEDQKKKKKFREKFSPSKKELRTHKKKVVHITPGGLIRRRKGKYFYPRAERSRRFFMLL